MCDSSEAKVVTLAGSRICKFLWRQQQNNNILNTKRTFPPLCSRSFWVSWEANLKLYSSTAESGTAPTKCQIPERRTNLHSLHVRKCEATLPSVIPPCMLSSSLLLIIPNLKATFELKSGDPPPPMLNLDSSCRVPPRMPSLVESACYK